MTDLREFHERRLEAEQAAASKSACREAANAHRDLARLHAERLARLGDEQGAYPTGRPM